MRNSILNLLLVVCLTGGVFAQNSNSTSTISNSSMQTQLNQSPNVSYEHGQVIQNQNSNANIVNHNNAISTNSGNNTANSTHHAKNGNHSLGPVWDSSACGLNYVQASVLVETRYNPYAVSTFGTCLPTNLTISSLPPNAIVLKSYVWWEVSYQAGSSTTPSLTITNPNGSTSTITATMVGQDGPKCWGEQGTRTFRVDLPIAQSQQSGGSIGCNGVYHVNITGNTCWEIDGITLFIVYIDPIATYTGHIYLDDGCISMVAGTITQNVNGMSVCANSTYGEAFSISCDWQDNLVTPHDATFNNILYPNTYANGFYEFDKHIETFTSGQTTCLNGFSSGSDCYCWIQTGVYYQTACAVCTPTSGSGIVVVNMDSTKTNTTCNQANGSAWVIASGGSGSPYSYLWSTGATTDTASNLAAGWYYVTVTDASGCHSVSDSVFILSSASVAVTLSATNVTCNGLSTGIIIADTSGGIAPFTYQWSPVGGNTLTANGVPAGNYVFVITDAIGCTRSATITVTEPPPLTVTSAPTNVLCYGTATGTIPLNAVGGTPAYSYVWFPVQGNVATAINLTAGIYNVTVTDANGCTITNNSVVTQPAQLTLSVSPNTTICIGQAANLLTYTGGGTQPYSFAWSNGSISSAQQLFPIVTTKYAVTVTDFNGCTLPGDSITIFVNPPLAVVAQASATICQGESATISAVATGGNGIYFYHWDQGIGIANGVITVTPTVTTIYSVIVTDSCTIPNVVASDTIFVNYAPVVKFQGLPLTGCNPLSVKFNNFTTCGNAIGNWNWDFGDGTAHGDSAAPTHIYYKDGLHTVTLTATSVSGCVSSLTDSNYVDVFPTPVARFMIDPLTTSIISPEIRLTDESLGADTLYYDFGDGNTTTVRNPYHSYLDTGMYWITQYVYNNYGCKDSISGTVTITMDYEFYIPSAFTPGNNGLNDYFTGVGRGVKDYKMWIFDRWGELLFYTEDLGNGWDGNFNGTPVKQDSYIYEIYMKDNNNIAHEYVGKVTLMR